MKIQVLVRLKSGVLDVQGKAVENGLKSMRCNNVTGVRVGKLIEFDLEGSSVEEARKQVDELCQKLLTNTIIENYEVQTS